jgi:UMF1 family MFS transporter
MIKGNKKIINAWTFYDWANSVYPLVITTSIFPIFYAAKIDGLLEDTGLDFVKFFGYELSGTVLFSYVVSASLLVVALLSPILSGIADYAGNKKSFLKFFCYLGAISTASLYFFDAHQIELSMMSIFFASIGFWNSLVFYNAYLPEIAEKKDHDRISAKGFSMGYIGASTLLIICLLGMDKLGLPGDAIIRAEDVFLLVALWWIAFSHYTYYHLPKETQTKKITKDILFNGFSELKLVGQQIKGILKLKRFLYAFFAISMGVQTLMTIAVLFAEDVVFKDTDDKSGLIIAVLIIQFIAIPGAYIFNIVSRKIGDIKTLTIAAFIWASLCLFTYFFVKEPIMFYFLAGLVGFVMGGTQALSRSTYSKLLPETKDTASFFSFYDVTEKIGMVIGIFLFGFVEDVSGDITTSVLFLTTVFVISFVLLLLVPKKSTQL